ncbi:unnamed protein product [Phyllotreta striolata]|uniref:Uncharacterized protein n=1 Tax=Phyllotreta striolata TaxID=444603 RepID=A0A9N9TTK1_PHYSR|nr:unnamed protein product [Phyllotreta striolata]
MPGDSYYWSPEHPDPDEFLEKDPYIDPWDLENYAYIREHLESMEINSNPSVPSGSSGEFAEPTSSFDYVPARRRPVSVQPREERFDTLMSDHESYAAIDDLNNYCRRNRRTTASEIYWPTRKRMTYDYEIDGEEVSPYAEGVIQENSVFGIYDENGIFRRVAVPIGYKTRDRSLSYSYGDFDHYQHFNQRGGDSSSTLEELRERIDRQDTTLPIYDDTNRYNRNKPQNFGFSKYGHLKIDYSCSWNNLNKFMKYN